MSGIDTGRFDQRLDPLVPQTNVARSGRTNRARTVTQVETRRKADEKSAAVGTQATTEATAIYAPVLNDLDPLRFAQRERMIADLTRIAFTLEDLLQDAADAED
ncbi:MAG: hypothetical protein AAF638_08010, partial [Pseudomonadota bacterium]